MRKGNVILNFTDFGNREWKDRLNGGKADEKKPEDFDQDTISIGTAVEREHTNNPDIATEISMDHSAQNDTYYDELIMSGIADEKDAVEIFNDVKTKEEKEFIIKKLQNRLDKEKEKIDMEEDEDFYDENDFENDKDDIEDFEDDDDDEYLEDFDEDELGTDKSDVEDYELVIDEEDKPKNKKKVMENAIKNYKSFLNVNEAEEVVPPVEPTEAAPERKFTKENKYKFQLPYDKKVVDKLNNYNFTYFVPDDQKGNVVKPTPSTHFIIIDMLNLNYAIVNNANKDLRMIDSSRIKHLLDNL